MRFASIVAVVGLAAAGSAWAAGESATRLDDSTLPLENVITKPDWLERPTADDLERYYPTLATTMQLGGRATIQCQVNAAGRLAQCRVVSETPLGLGFGAAALNMAPAFRMKALTVDGTPVDGGQVTIPINFRTPPDSPVDLIAPAPSSAKSLEIARQILVLNGQKAAFDRAAARSEASLDAAFRADPPATPAEAAARQVALDAVRASRAQMLSKLLDLHAARLAEMPPEQLEAVLAFLQSPAGKAYAVQLDAASAEADVIRALSQTASREARTSFCAKVQCADTPAVAAAPPPPAVSAPPPAKRRRRP